MSEERPAHSSGSGFGLSSWLNSHWPVNSKSPTSHSQDVDSSLLSMALKQNTSHTAVDTLSRILEEMKTCESSSDLLTRYSNDLRIYIESQETQLSAEGFTKFMNDLNRRIFDLVGSQVEHERLCGITIIDSLMDFQYEENEKQVERFAKYLGMLLEQPSLSQNADSPLLKRAAKAIGHLARSGGTLTADFVEKQVRTALSWLEGERVEQKRYAATLVLHQLALEAPTMFIQFVSTFLDHIWVALRDPKSFIRESATESLRACLEMISRRDRKWKLQWYFKIWAETQKGLTAANPDSIHGSLLTMGELLASSGEFMLARFKECCDVAIQFKDSRGLIRDTVIQLFPKLAEYCPSAFCRGYLDESLLHIISTLQAGVSKNAGFNALGSIAVSVGPVIEKDLNSIINLIHSEISQSGKKSVCSEALNCLGLLAQAMGPKLTKYIEKDLLSQVFQVKLSPSLIEALNSIALHIPSLVKTIQEELMSAISRILSGTSDINVSVSTVSSHASRPSILHNVGGTSLIKKPRQSGLINMKKSISNPSPDEQVSEIDTTMITLALKTLSTFNLKSSTLLSFVRDVVATYLERDDATIRQQAAITCSTILLDADGSNDPIKLPREQVTVINEVLEKLLTVAIADSAPIIRQTVLQKLDSRYDPYLVQPFCLKVLFIALKDEEISIRSAAMQILGRLAAYNPAYVMPVLRKTLLQLLTLAQFATDSRSREESAQLLGILMASSESIVRSYVPSILKIMVPLLSDQDSAASSAALNTLGHLSNVGGSDMRQHLENLVPLIIDGLKDQASSSRREVALRTMGQLVESTGWVIEPYMRYIELLPIVLSILKVDQSWSVRREAIKLLGILGALDPFKHKMNVLTLTRKSESDNSTSASTSSLISDEIGSFEENEETYFAAIAINSLIKILKDPGLSQHHNSVTSAVMFILSEMGLKSATFLPVIIPQFLIVMKSCEESLKASLFLNLSDLVQIVELEIRPFLDGIFELIHQTWLSDNTILFHSSLKLVSSVSMSLSDDFQVYLPTLIPKLISILHADRSINRIATLEILKAFETFGSSLADYIDLIIGPLMALCEMLNAPVDVRKKAVLTIGKLAKCLDFAPFMSRIIHPFVRVLSGTTASCISLRESVLKSLCLIIFQLEFDFAPFIPLVDKVLSKQRISAPQYRALVSKMLRGQRLTSPRAGLDTTFEEEDESALKSPREAPSPVGKGSTNRSEIEKLDVNQAVLKKAWEASQKSTKEDWTLWMKNLSIQLVKFSPSLALRTCQQLAAKHPPLARELFNVAFASCWSELYDHFQDDLVKNLEKVFQSPAIPPEVLQTLLNLAEFMERHGIPLPIKIGTLGELAANGHAYAKALYYKELQFQNNPHQAIQSLISINNQLQQPEAAVGILQYAQRNLNFELKESWYEKLNQWEDALGAYERKQLADPLNNEMTLGRMRCLSALGEWERVLSLSTRLWDKSAEEIGVQARVAPLAAAAAWNLGQWDNLNEFITELDADGSEGSFFKAILAVRFEKYDEALSHIEDCRKLLSTDLSALLGESYNRAYRLAVQIQQLAELEEIISYKTCNLPERRNLILKMWRDRLVGCQRDVDVWQQLLSVRSLVLSPREDVTTWLKFSSLCRKSGRLNLSHKVLVSLLGSDPVLDPDASLPMDYPQVTFSFLKHLWAAGYREDAYSKLGFVILHLESNNSESRDLRLLSRCTLRRGQWHLELNASFDDVESTDKMLSLFKASTEYDPKSYKALHWWALVNYQMVSHFETSESKKSKAPDFAVPAVNGFFSSIDLGGDMSLQDTLRLLSLCFKYGHFPKVERALEKGFDSISIDTWLTVIPQIIARINISKAPVRRLVHDVLHRIGLKHPQALIYPLTVASKSQSQSRKLAALSILRAMQKHSQTLVEQAETVSFELIRTAILWHEMWHEGLEQASHLYFGSKNIEGMLSTLAPLHEMLENGPKTLHEKSFMQSYGRDLSLAKEWCIKYTKSQKESDINQAWELYIYVFRKIDKLVRQITDVQLQYVSPRLLEARDLELAVPGTYTSGCEIVRILNFQPSMRVLSSKQRPRKLTLRASDGKDYPFLLKGHEDLRQDERVMQLFSLVNTLLSNDRITSKGDLNIRGYAVIPLAPSSGLIEWLGHCDTLHDVIQEYRSRKKILLNLERLLMLQYAPEKQFQQLMVIQMADVFEQALSCTSGNDVHAMLWLKSQNSEIWLDRRTNYIRSLAVMSMVGYILGLGDRHPCNLMLDRITGKIIHIDFGDCFEVAMQRDKFPETIPFRLTRMLVNAMEVSGIEGTFRTTCENVMRVLRDNKESVMAVLEAFVHDPLINWRLLGNDASPRYPSPNQDVGIDAVLDEFSRHAGGRGAAASFHGDEDKDSEALNDRAVKVTARIWSKLIGTDFEGEELGVEKQVDKLILQATSLENLSQCYVGWCPFW